MKKVSLYIYVFCREAVVCLLDWLVFVGLDYLNHLLFAVCLETVGSEESSFYLLPEGIPQAISHWTNIMTMMMMFIMMAMMMMLMMTKVTTQEGPPKILANSSAKSIHVSTGEIWTSSHNIRKGLEDIHKLQKITNHLKGCVGGE